jgi:serine/threonine-protein kinase
MFKARQRLGKYRIVRRVSHGTYADVYHASDTVEGRAVALKIPHPNLVTGEMLDDFKAEVQVTARLDHPNILPIKNADFIDGSFVIVYHLGIESLADRLQRRLSLSTAHDYAAQLMKGLAHAHRERIIHCDVKPENLIVFPRHRLRLTDFGISKVAHKTMSASGSGTVGYVAPEQALGKPRFQSDVFSAAIVIYQMVSGVRPEWPFRWPLPGQQRLRRNAPTELIAFLRRCLEVDYRKRYADCAQMLQAWQRLQPALERFGKHQRRKRRQSRRSRRR